MTPAFLSLSNWAWYEFVITLLAVAATIRAAQVLHESRCDEVELRRNHIDGPLLDLVEGSQMVEWIRVGVKITFIIYGFWVGFTETTPFSRGVSIAILIVALILMYAQGEVSIRLKRSQLRAQGVEPHADRKHHDNEPKDGC